MGESGLKGKSFEIPKQLVWEAYRRVAANKGAAGVDGVTIEDFETDLKNNLYKIWNRMSSGTYFPPPVKSVEIPKPLGGGTRTLGVPTVADRIAQTVVALELEARTEEIFHDDSYGYGRGSFGVTATSEPRMRLEMRKIQHDAPVLGGRDATKPTAVLPSQGHRRPLPPMDPPAGMGGGAPSVRGDHVVLLARAGGASRLTAAVEDSRATAPSRIW